MGVGGRVSVPSDEQHTGLPTVNEEHKDVVGLLVVNSAVVMPHLAARLSQESPSMTSIEEQVVSRF